MRTFERCLLPILGALALQCDAQSVISYSTFGPPGDAFDHSSGWLVNGSANPPQPYVGEAFTFAPIVSGFFSELDIVIRPRTSQSDLAAAHANISLSVNGNGNVPGARLETFPNIPSTYPLGPVIPITSLNSSRRPWLQAGSSYWLIVEPTFPSTEITVFNNSMGVMANQAQSFSPNGWIARGSKTTFAFTVVVTQVPEPRTSALASLAILALGLRLVRR